ncbi:transcription antitermination factor NusB [Gaoshiqia sediminis]|uniref:Transcription antitermination protein NusB n=1 Tax=Gaoshiqia sediminis TaxID=2986998 RepID=A0AA41YA41_9BACT|nr:transcription antitermination factor NusB [Gaoshiqia sediminis]MCW0482258.1 transcription antitermination factor NusB [Gaoshiqia sediminis]
MISRRIIRIKVLQVLYAFYTSPDKSINNTEKELFFSIQKTYDLYHYLFQLAVEIANHANSVIELRKKKHFPTAEDLTPNTRFVNNLLIYQLKTNNALNKQLAQSKLSWEDEPELIKKLYTALINTDFYAEYMSAKEHSYLDDKKLVEQLFGEVILQSEDLLHLLEEQSIYWNDDIDFVVSMIIKTLKKFKEYSREDLALLPFFKDEEDREFAKNLYRKTVLNHDELKKIVEEHTVNWDVERIAVIDNLILELAMAEFLYFPSIPTKVTLNEYIELSKYYSTQKSRNFINGILDKSLKALKKENRVIKAGRGLIGEETPDE